jgi:hypothetical protein
MKAAAKQKTVSHARFWGLLKEMPGYDERYRDVIKEATVHEYSGGKTQSLSEMYAKYPQLYSRMIFEMRNDNTNHQRDDRYDSARNTARRGVLAAIYTWLDKNRYTFNTDQEKRQYAIKTACRAASCARFNDIPESQLSAIYNLFCKKNKVDIGGDPIIDYHFSQQ